MAIRAEVAKSYLWRLVLMAVFCLGLSAWCVYDGAIAYPNQRERALACQKIRKENKSQTDPEAWKAVWEEYAKSRGWPTENPGKPHNEYDFLMQYFMASVAAPVGLFFLGSLVRWRNRWIEADENGVQTSWGSQLAYDAIDTLDKQKWRKKGIAVIRYQQDDRAQKVSLDDFKFEPDETEEILRLVESRIELEQITGGLPQPPKEDPELAADTEVHSDPTVDVTPDETA